MPTYSYKCTECATAFDTQQAFTDDSLTVCPNCGGKLRKVFSAVGVTFNGSGFYRNDSRSKPSDAKSANSNSNSTETKSSDSKPSESKGSESKSSESKSSGSQPASASSTPAASSSKAAG